MCEDLNSGASSFKLQDSKLRRGSRVGISIDPKSLCIKL